MLIAMALLTIAARAWADGTGTVTWSGQGVECDEYSNCVLKTELCGTENGADVDGPYLLWVFTGGPSTTAATISISGCGTETGGAMGQAGGGAWKYISHYCDPNAVHAEVSYTYAGRGPANPQLTISHGCKPVESANLWCSPGFWRNADDAAWARTPYHRTDLYNSTSCGSTNPVTGDPTLQQVLSSPQTYGGPAFNCVGQLLTNSLCGGGQLNPACPGAQAVCPDACPLDNHGNIKEDAPAVCQP
jgi:hypothetical protein